MHSKALRTCSKVQIKGIQIVESMREELPRAGLRNTKRILQ